LEVASPLEQICFLTSLMSDDNPDQQLQVLTAVKLALQVLKLEYRVSLLVE